MRGCAVLSLLVLAVAGLGLGCTEGAAKIAVDSKDGIYDLGSGFHGGMPLTTTITVTNFSDRKITLSSVEHSSGDAVKIAGKGDDQALFSIDFTPTALEPGRHTSFVASFDPRSQCDDFEDRSTTLLFHVEGSPALASATLRARFATGQFEGYGTIDFGGIQVGSATPWVAGFTVRNPTDLPWTLTLGDITSRTGDASAFAFAPDSPQGVFTLAPESERDVSFLFRPTELKTYSASVRIYSDVTCYDVKVPLTGTGVSSELSWEPGVVDCGYLPPGVTGHQQITFRNVRASDVELSDITTDDPTEFFVESSSAGPDKTKLTVPARGMATLTVACKPAVLGERQTKLRFHTSIESPPQGEVVLKVVGGGPRIMVLPSPAIDFGKVAYFAGAHPASFSARHLEVLNSGSLPDTPDVNANLKLGDPAFTIIPTNADTSADEFSVSIDPRYDPAVGLEAKAGKNRAVLRVTLTPKSTGLKQAELRINSNDPAQPVVKIALSANAVVLPPCNYSLIGGSGLDFGLVPGGESRDLRFSIQNNGTAPDDICLLSGVEVDPLSDAAFSLTQRPVASIELQPGERTDFTVRARPQGATPSTLTSLQGHLEFSISSPVQGGWISIPLEVSTGPSCVTIAPNDFDFGTVKLGCSSVTRTFNLYDTCSSPVTVNSFQMVQGAGQLPGSPQCVGSAPCPEFQLVQTPAIPSGGLVLSPSAPLTFQVKYRPIDENADLGAVAVTVDQNGTSATNLVDVRGNGSATGVQTDTIDFDARPKADLLFVIDTSAGMVGDQQKLAAQAAFLPGHALVDYRFASTSADMGPAGAKGRFVYGPESARANLSSAIELGDLGSASQMVAEATLAALTAPLINSDNAGFLRHDAPLGVIALTAGPDLSPRTTTYYLERFWNVKGWSQRNQFTFNAIAPLTQSCVQSRGGGDTGELALYASQTDGDAEDLCAYDSNQAWKVLNSAVSRTDFFLTATPELSTGSMTVQIDGSTVPPVDSRGATIWTFDPVSNQVHFESAYVPESGQTLTISYPTACNP